MESIEFRLLLSTFQVPGACSESEGQAPTITVKEATPAMHAELTESKRNAPCDLCGETHFQIVSKHDRRGADLVTVVCKNCGLLSHERIPTDEELQQYYARQYRAAYHGEYSPSAYRVLREWARGRSLVRLLSPHLQPADEITEIGCGIGCTVKNLECAGFRASGIEPGEGFRRFAVERLRADVRAGMLQSLPAEPIADVILLVHVLEHLRDPTASLQHIHALLAKGGRLYIEVPNAGVPHSAPGKMFHVAHIHNFTRPTLAALARKTGFETTAWLDRPDDRNLRLFLTRADKVDWHVESGSYQATLDALSRYTVLGYHLRWRYLRERAGIILHHTGNRILAQRRLQLLLRKCE